MSAFKDIVLTFTKLARTGSLCSRIVCFVVLFAGLKATEAKSSLLDSVDYNKYIPGTHVDTSNPTSWLLQNFLEYRGGKLGSEKIGIHIAPGEKPGELVGYYFLYRDLRDISLAGRIEGKRDIVLFEKDSTGKTISTFKFHFPERKTYHSVKDYLFDYPPDDGLTGEWSSLSGAKCTVNFKGYDTGKPHIGRYDSSGGRKDLEIEKNIQDFYYSVIKGDKEHTSILIHFPFRVYFKHRSLELYTSEEFLKNYNIIFTPKLVGSFKTDVPHNLYVASTGIAFLNGLVWFDSEGNAEQINYEMLEN
jgi:hypothetical protein